MTVFWATPKQMAMQAIMLVKKKQSNGLLFHPISDGKGLEKDNKTPFFMVGDSVKNVDNTSAASSGEKHRHIPPNLTFVCTESSNFYGVQSEYEVQSSRMFQNCGWCIDEVW